MNGEIREYLGKMRDKHKKLERKECKVTITWFEKVIKSILLSIYLNLHKMHITMCLHKIHI